MTARGTDTENRRRSLSASLDKKEVWSPACEVMGRKGRGRESERR